jgi:subtilisin family serine protease
MKRLRITRDNIRQASKDGFHKMRMKGDRAFVSVLIEAKPGAEQALRHLGAEAIHRFGSFCTADVPVDAVDTIASLPEVIHIRAARKLRPLTNQSVHKFTGSIGMDVPETVVMNGGERTFPPPFEASGVGVICGIVDTGIDVYHDDFKHTSGSNTRILYFWDQEKNGNPPSGFSIGYEWDATDINNSSCNSVDNDGHGTHVAGTCAGNGRATGYSKPNYRYVGAAPESDIISVLTTFYDTDIMEGVRYIFKKAQALGRPATVNLSLGGQFGAHDGSDSFDRAIDELTGPGRIVVVASGNEGDEYVHNSGTVPGQNQSVTFRFNVPSYPEDRVKGNDWIAFDLWHWGEDTLRLTFKTPGNKSSKTFYPTAEQTSWDYELTADGDIWVINYTTGVNEKRNIYIEIDDYTDKKHRPEPGNWEITITGHSIDGSDPNEVQGWIGAYSSSIWNYGYVKYTNGDNNISVGSPGSAKSAITVGAYITKVAWLKPGDVSESYANLNRYYGVVGDIANFSSLGPTWDGRTKPDISAPGVGIAATLASNWASDSYYVPRTVEDGVHVIMQGTSMSCPHINGLVALLLMKHPTYTPAALKSIMAYTAFRDSYVPSMVGNTWGWGKASAQQALAHADLNKPRATSAALYPPSPNANSTLRADAFGFVPKSATSPERYLYQWQKFKSASGIWVNIPGAHHQRLGPGNAAASDTVRCAVTPCEHIDDPPNYQGLLLGPSVCATQTIQSGSTYSSHTGQTGWSMVSIPTQDNTAILSDFPNSTFWQWNETKQSYEATTTIKQGRGYWVSVPSERGYMHSEGVESSGDFITPQLSCTSVTTYKPGRHFLGNPHNDLIHWENILVSTSPGSFSLSVTDPGASPLIHNVYYTDYSSTSGYLHYDPTDFDECDGTIGPWQGFWVIVKQAVYLKILKNQSAPDTWGATHIYPLAPLSERRRTSNGEAAEKGVTEQTSDEVTGKTKAFAAGGESAHRGQPPGRPVRRRRRRGWNRKGWQDPPEGSWRLKISAVSGKLRDNYNYIGVHPWSLEDYDPNDIPDAGTLNSQYIMLYTEHDDWGRESGKYCVDIHSTLHIQQWDLTAKATGLEEPVTIYWRRAPEDWKLELYDVIDNVRVDMNGQRSYTYTPYGDEERPFTVYAQYVGDKRGKGRWKRH